MKTYKYIALAALALGFAACTQDDDFTPQQEDIVKIASANIATEVQTRVNTLGDGTSWENNDQILLVNNSRTTNKNSGTYTYDGTNWELSEGVVLYASTGTNNFTAYYPASVDFTLPTEQNTEAGIKSADRMVATATGIAKGDAVALSFERQNAMVTITPSFNTEFGDDATISSLQIAGITPFHPEDAEDYKAIIAPSTTGFEVSVKVKVGEAEQTLTANTTTAIEAGKHYTFNLTVGKTAVGITSVSVNNWSEKPVTGVETEQEAFVYNPATNSYEVHLSRGMQAAIDAAELTGTAENPATVTLLADVEVEAVENDYGIIEYAVLIESGNIVIDLNGCQLSATNDPDCTIQIGAEWGETCDAVVTIDDSSADKSGKIIGSLSGINNNGGTLIFNNGTIAINNTDGAVASAGISSCMGTITVNGGTINVTGVAEYSITSGINESSSVGTVTINGGSINVNAPSSYALKARSTWYVNGGTITSNGYHVDGGTIYLSTNDEGIGATFVEGIKCYKTINSFLNLTEGVGYYDADGNLVEVANDVKEITDKGDITVKKNN